MSEYRSFETDRLLLQPTSEEDASFLLELLNSPKWLEYIGDRNVHTVEEARSYIFQKITPQFQRLGFANYTVVRKADGAKMGTCGLYDREGLEGVDIGFAFLPQYERKGYALESAQQILEVGFNVFDLKKISAITTRDNIASQRLLEKLGLEYHRMIRIPGDEEELMYYVSTKYG